MIFNLDETAFITGTLPGVLIDKVRQHYEYFNIDHKSLSEDDRMKELQKVIQHLNLGNFTGLEKKIQDTVVDEAYNSLRKV